MKEKKIIPCIYLCNKIAVKGLQDRTLVDADPLSLAKFYENNGADALLIFDMSDSDESHEEALDIIKSIKAFVYLYTTNILFLLQVQHLNDQ